MKAMKKVFALLMLAALVLSLGVTAFADDPAYSITVNNTPSSTNVSIVGKTFNAYKIFDVTTSQSISYVKDESGDYYKDLDTNTYTTGEAPSNCEKDDSDNPVKYKKVTTDNYAYTISNTSDWWNAVLLYMGGGTTAAVANATTGVYTGNGITLTPKAGDSSAYVVTKEDNFDARAFADFLTGQTSGKTPDGTATGAAVADSNPVTEKATISMNAPGYYLVTGESKATDGSNPETVVAAAALDTAAPSAEIELKAEAPKLDKEITDSNGNSNATSAQVGDTVDFKLSSNVPDTNGYTTYTYIVSDTLSDGLTLNVANPEANTFTVKVGDTEVELTKADTEDDLTGNKYYIDGQTFKISLAMLANNGDAMYTKGQAITIEYSATLNKNALTLDKETNTATLTYSSNPYDDSKKNTTPEDIVYVYDFDIVIDKYAVNANDDTDTSTKLVGAEFVLLNSGKNKFYQAVYTYTCNEGTDHTVYSFDGTTYYADTNFETPVTIAEGTELTLVSLKVNWVDDIANATKITTDSNGKASFQGLEEGTYYLHETAAPTGYNLLTADQKVDITAEYNDDGTIKTTSATTSTSTPQYQQTVQVANNTGTELPSTGGIGTTIFTVVGIVLMAGAAIILITKKRMN